jgi:hypothetical protein
MPENKSMKKLRIIVFFMGERVYEIADNLGCWFKGNKN